MKRGVVSNNYLSCKYKYIYQGLGPPTILVLRQYEDLLRKLEKVMCIKTEDVVLDVGCGSGDLIFSLVYLGMPNFYRLEGRPLIRSLPSKF